MGFLERRRALLESGAGGDHDVAYQFALPTSMLQILAWVKLLVRNSVSEKRHLHRRTVDKQKKENNHDNATDDRSGKG